MSGGGRGFRNQNFDMESFEHKSMIRKKTGAYIKTLMVLYPLPMSCKKLVQMDLKLQAEFEERRGCKRPYPAPQNQVEEIERWIQECIEAGWTVLASHFLSETAWTRT